MTSSRRLSAWKIRISCGFRVFRGSGLPYRRGSLAFKDHCRPDGKGVIAMLEMGAKRGLVPPVKHFVWWPFIERTVV